MPVIADHLDDVEALVAADREGLLRSAAMAGPQVRAIAEAQAEGVLEPLATVRPRAVVIVVGGSLLAARAANVIVAAVAERIDVPLVVGSGLPGWIGPLDVVVIAGSDAGDRMLSDALSRAARRRAEIVMLAPLEGPLRDAAGVGRPGAVPLIDLSPRLPVDPRFSFTGLVAGLVAVLAGLTAVRCVPSLPSLAEIADLLDDEALAGHPNRESFHNRAKLLASRAAGQRVLWSGAGPASTAAAAQAAAAFGEIGGLPAGVADEAAAVGVLASAPVDPTAALFYDPDFDDAPASAAPRLFIVAPAARGWAAAARLSGYDVEIVTERGEVDEAGHEVSPTEPRVDTPADLAALLVIVARAQCAAAYLALTEAGVR